MTLPLCAVSCVVNGDGGRPEVGAVITATLSETDYYDGGVVAPATASATLDSNGFAVLNLWPNVLGSVGTVYNIKIFLPQGKTLRTTAVVPNTLTANLHEIVAPPVA